MATYHFNLMKLSVACKIWRNMNNLTGAEMAELCGVAKSTYGFIEQGDRAPSIAEFMSICDVIGFKPQEFIQYV